MSYDRKVYLSRDHNIHSYTFMWFLVSWQNSNINMMLVIVLVLTEEMHIGIFFSCFVLLCFFFFSILCVYSQLYANIMCDSSFFYYIVLYTYIFYALSLNCSLIDSSSSLGLFHRWHEISFSFKCNALEIDPFLLNSLNLWRNIE